MGVFIYNTEMGLVLLVMCGSLVPWFVECIADWLLGKNILFWDICPLTDR